MPMAGNERPHPSSHPVRDGRTLPRLTHMVPLGTSWRLFGGFPAPPVPRYAPMNRDYSATGDFPFSLFLFSFFIFHLACEDQWLGKVEWLFVELCHHEVVGIPSGLNGSGCSFILRADHADWRRFFSANICGICARIPG